MTLLPANHNYRRTNGTSLTGGKEMGLVYAEIELLSIEDLILSQYGIRLDSEVRKVKKRALVDSGALDLVIGADVKEQLNLKVRGKRSVRLADDSVIQVEMVGPLEVRFENRSTIVNAVVLPTEEVLLGAIPMESLDVFIDPVRQRLVVNPESPDIPMSQIKKCA
ncbi:MAG TPA: aspartyl protease family protein [Pyrinomonadaceae bacterium]|nr:aspartyl protease family protein [Pyrinomonadaceae bacterium]